jgi:hypothetical protein
VIHLPAWLLLTYLAMAFVAGGTVALSGVVLLMAAAREAGKG